MYIKVSKVFADFVKKTAHEKGFRASARVVVIPESHYQLLTGCDLWDAVYYRDVTVNGIRAIEISYPYGYYAPCRYLTTATLVQEFRSRRVQSVDDLKEMVRDLVEI